MEKSFDKLVALPGAREVIRAWIALNALIGNDLLGNDLLAAVQDDIKLAALHMEDAIRTMVSELPDK